MVPSNRGSAGALSLVLATALLLAAAWLAFGLGNRMTGKSRASPGPEGPRGEAAQALIAGVDDLSTRIEEGKDTVVVPAGIELARLEPAVTEDAPDVGNLRGTVDGSFIVLTWTATGEPEGFRVERLDDAGDAVARFDLGPDAREYRDGPVDALSGTRTYRVLALGPGKTPGGAHSRPVSFRTVFQVEFTGATGPDEARFLVTWERAGETVAEEFLVPKGGEIGQVVPPKGDRPALDFRTGWRFLRLAGKRRTEEARRTKVPRFTPEGSLFRDPDSGQVVFEEWEVEVVTVVVGAEVRAPAEDGSTRDLWLEMAKD